MTTNKDADKAKAELRVNLAAALIYFGYRVLGATKEHAWERARLDTANAIIDKTIEKIGLVDPRRKGEDGIQGFFEGGSIDGQTRFVADCGAVSVTQKVKEPGDERCHVYRRTNRMRGQQVIFAYRGLLVPPATVSALDESDEQLAA